jgi:hypothetical protein
VNLRESLVAAGLDPQPLSPNVPSEVDVSSTGLTVFDRLVQHLKGPSGGEPRFFTQSVEKPVTKPHVFATCAVLPGILARVEWRFEHPSSQIEIYRTQDIREIQFTLTGDPWCAGSDCAGHLQFKPGKGKSQTLIAHGCDNCQNLLKFVGDLFAE